eukprot:m.316260 g.316260  ORF g.316260 m.316260 type:complete len:369 (+) comp16501_c0_seq17:43-1149(+)
MLVFSVFIVVALLLVSQTHAVDTPDFELVKALPYPVINSTRAHMWPGAPNSGFEGGLYFRTSDGKYHLFPSECMLDRKGVPWDVHMESHHWTSPDGINNWIREELIYNSSANMNGTDRRGAIWAPMPIFDTSEQLWNLFYVGYTCNPGQVDGAIYRLTSSKPGLNGIAGPYANATIILDMEGVGGDVEPWEGGDAKRDQGDDSFFPWQLDNGTWMAFYGAHSKASTKDPTWKVGLITADKLAGPWRRMPWLNPAEYIETPEGIENPIVTRTTDKTFYVAVFDALMPDQIHGHSDVVGITYAADGVHFSAAQYVSLNASYSGCGSPVRTAQGLVPEPEMCAGCYSMLYTGHGNGYANECWVLLRNKAEA